MTIDRTAVVQAIVEFPFYDYGLDDFPVIDDYDKTVTEVVNDLADAVVEKLLEATSE